MHPRLRCAANWPAIVRREATTHKNSDSSKPLRFWRRASSLLEQHKPPTRQMRTSLITAEPLAKLSRARHRSRTRPWRRRTSGRAWSRCRRRCWCWTRLRAISAARVKRVEIQVVSAPDDHLITSPYSGMKLPRYGRVGDAGSRPTVHVRIISPAGVCNAQS